jgi:hypothetical protein
MTPRWLACADPSRSCYEIVVERGFVTIRFLPCGVMSYHPEDIKQRYCALCHSWVEKRDGERIMGTATAP